MGDTYRLNQELLNFGFGIGDWSNGQPILNLSEPELTVFNAVVAAHIADDATYDKTDLEAYPPAIALKALVTTQQWDDYKTLQQTTKNYYQEEKIYTLIKSLAKLIYEVGEAGGSLTAANLKPWRDKVKVLLEL